MKGNLEASALYNAPAGAYVDTSTVSGKVKLPSLPEWSTGDLKSVTIQTATAEITQAIDLDGASGITIALNTQYKIKGNVRSELENQWHTEAVPYGGTLSAATSAAADRHYIYSSIAKQINSVPRSFFAGAIVTLTHVASTVFTIQSGKQVTWVKGSVSGTVGFILKTADSTTTSTKLCVYNGIAPVVGDILSVMNDPFDQTNVGAGGPSTAVTVVALGVGVRIVDKPGYMNAFGNRKGISTWSVYKGFATTALSTVRAGVYPVGQGADLLKLVPKVETTSGNLIAGTLPFFPTNEAPVSGTSYNIINLEVVRRLNNDAQTGGGHVKTVTYRVYANNVAGGYAAFVTALQALL